MLHKPKVRPDKQKVIDEVWDDERIRGFLTTSTPTQAGQKFPGDHDFYVLLRAYQAMRVFDFERFLKVFIEDGGNVLAKNGRGQTLADYLATHRKATPFIEVLNIAAT